MSDDLTAFWRARLSEREVAARAALAEAQRVQQTVAAPHTPGRHIPGWHSWAGVEEEATRALRDIEADRLLLVAYEDQEGWLAGLDDPGIAPDNPDWTKGAQDALLAAIELRVSVYSDHLDYKPEWKP